MTAEPTENSEAIEQGRALVYSLASKIYRTLPVRADLDDLIAYGEIGLQEAAREFDAEKGARFTTFAYYRIRGAIYDGVSSMCWTSRARYRRMRFEQMSNELISDDSSDYKSGDSSLESEARWFRQMTEKLGVVYLTSQCSGDDSSPDMNFESPQEGAASIVANREIVEKLRDLIGKLPNDHARLIRAIYFEGATLQEAANRQGMSKSWASRLHAKILESLGKMLRQIGASD